MSGTTYVRWIDVRHYRGESPERVRRRAARIIRRSLGQGPERLSGEPWARMRLAQFLREGAAGPLRSTATHFQYMTRREQRSAAVRVMQSPAIRVNAHLNDLMRAQAMKKMQAFAKEQGCRILEDRVRWERGVPERDGTPWTLYAVLE
jgi:hypothetical protein